jgi:hypothetical protein
MKIVMERDDDAKLILGSLDNQNIIACLISLFLFLEREMLTLLAIQNPALKTKLFHLVSQFVMIQGHHHSTSPS